ncbi:hypothetical protein BPC006_I1172 [Burkholderia pseudomallei BPC006]|nr:hypothetical protein BPC006_I1172 [Burkholderia pseudomallei BPC006]
MSDWNEYQLKFPRLFHSFSWCLHVNLRLLKQEGQVIFEYLFEPEISEKIH